MSHVRSAALNFLVPAGCVYDPPDQRGLASVLSELITRGAGARDRVAPTGSANLTPESIRRHHARYFQPRACILSVAGNIEWGPLKEQVGRLFADWQPGEQPELELKQPVGGRTHLSKDTTQT